MPAISQAKANMTDPREHAVWALSPVPIDEQGTPLVLPLMALQFISEHLWCCGFRHHPDLQEITASEDAHTAFMAGGVAWVPISEATTPTPEVDLSALSEAEVAAVEAALERRKKGM
ncbi:phage gene 29 protein family protein [Corynebacterium oculi]|uniref:DUF2744 domain-containing protein n=1 Tax=Corynebacterium oculi TaxID=1544416 RepID=A0A0Q0TXW5_9CORY|nr:DUF2744 domain-containing protein [Corynebacterium oculi]KQB83897.1 hypothetical protein Cocul_01973 [Corynebacterium oculi]